jgi:hypothetical protein
MNHNNFKVNYRSHSPFFNICKQDKFVLKNLLSLNLTFHLTIVYIALSLFPSHFTSYICPDSFTGWSIRVASRGIMPVGKVAFLSYAATVG